MLPAAPVSIASAPDVATASVEMTSLRGIDEVEVCGVGWVRAKDDGTADEAALASAPSLLAARRAIIEALRHDPDPFARAASIWMEPLGVEFEAQRQLIALGLAPCRDAECSSPDATRQYATSIRERLAREALSTQDPRVYALGFRACMVAPDEGSCALLSVGQWARLDADNALPWLFVLGQVRAGKDDAALNEALFRIGSAARIEDRLFAVPGLIVARAGPSDVDVAGALDLTVGAIGMASAQSAPLQSLLQACSGKALDDANRRQVCEAVATTLVERSDSLLLGQIGIGIGRRLGWPDERMNAFRGENGAYMASSATFGLSNPGCDGVRRDLQRIRRTAALGEVGAMHEWAASTGRSPESFASEERDRRLRAVAENAAQREAAAANTPPVPQSAEASSSTR